MHAMWKGSISFGLVNVPVRMYKATESHAVHFRQLHKVCKTPIQYSKRCPTCEMDVSKEDIVRGFEYARGQFAVIEDEELEQFSKTRSQTIDIVQFANERELDPVYYEQSYYLAPESSGQKAYALLAQAMDQAGQVAIARTVLRDRESIALIRIKDNVLMMQTMFWPNEVRSTEELPYVHQHPEIQQPELQMAVKLIGELSRPFDPTAFHDHRQAQIEELVQQKLEQGEIHAPDNHAPQNGDIVNLMEALQKSISMAKPAVKSSKRNKKKSS